MYQLDVISASSGQNILSATPTTNSYLASGLLCCNSYSFRVAASTSAGFGPPTSGPTLRTLADLTSKLICTFLLTILKYLQLILLKCCSHTYLCQNYTCYMQLWMYMHTLQFQFLFL